MTTKKFLRLIPIVVLLAVVAPPAASAQDDGDRGDDIGGAVITHADDVDITTGDTPRLRLAETGSSGFTPYSWDLGGNEANFFIRDVTGGSALPFRIRPGAPSSSIDIQGDGTVGVGISNPDGAFHIRDTPGGSVAELLRLEANTAPQQIFENNVSGAEWFFAMTADNQFKISRNGTGLVEAKFFDNGNLQIAGTLIQTSDANAKHDFATVDDAAILDAIAGLEISTWSYDSDPGVTHIGPTAQDFAAAFGVGGSTTGIASVDSDGVALAAIRALEAENDELRTELTELRALVEQLANG